MRTPAAAATAGAITHSAPSGCRQSQMSKAKTGRPIAQSIKSHGPVCVWRYPGRGVAVG